MADPTAEKLQNLNIQDNDISSTGAALENQCGDVDVDEYPSDVTNGHVGGQLLVDKGALIEGQTTGSGVSRKMSEREMMGYQNDYGGTFQSSAQMEYIIDSDEDDRNNFVEFGGRSQPQGHQAASDQDYYMSTGQPMIGTAIDVDAEPNMLSGDNIVSSPDSTSQQLSEDILGSPEAQGVSENMDYIDPENWSPHMDPLRSRRSRSPERSLSPPRRDDTDPYGDCSNDTERELVDNVHESGDSSAQQESSMELNIPRPHTSPHDSDSKLDKKDPKHRIGHIPRPLGSPKVSRAKKPLELPPWNDNVVIPKPPRMKPTLIGKQSDQLPPSPVRPKTAPSILQPRRQDASSDSGVEEDRSSKSDRKASADARKKYGTDTKNMKYKPGGGNIKIFNEKVETKTIGARTDSKPRAVLSPSRGSSSSGTTSPITPKLPTPNVKNVHSKIGSMDNARHTPGGGNIKVLSAKIDLSNVSSKVGSKDKIDHKPKGGDKKISTVKLSWNAESKVGSLKNATHSPGGGKVKILDEKVEIKAQSKIGSTANIKHKPGGGEKKIETQKLDFTGTAKSKVGSMDNVKHKAAGGDIKIFDEKVEFTEIASPKVGSMDKVKHKPGGGDKKIETVKLSFKETAKARTDSGTGSGAEKTKSYSSSRSESIASQDSANLQDTLN